MTQKKYWENVYSSQSTDQVSWFQEHASRSLALIQKTAVPHSASIIDVGGGASALVKDLLLNGYSTITVLDLSAKAIATAKERLGRYSAGVEWLEADITTTRLPVHSYDLWHDRAVFHFLTKQSERKAYVENVFRSVKPGGHVIIAAFTKDGPTRCSGLPVMRYSATELHAEFGSRFNLIHSEKEEHHTPSGSVQRFIYCYCRLARNKE
ncbi:MAG: class I SAM-dependent methyltransferase [Candidatus Thiodiazotropha sp. (ex Epidulcina cf. delphinae)]|nr:class I SAM-dependent methyltransferase [Candidatus Thiodiazotropha sp. (ex Epidulcina cf. delphinae)]